MDADLLSGLLADPEAAQPELLLSDSLHSSLTAQTTDLKAHDFTNNVLINRDPNRSCPGTVISKIEDTFESMIDCLIGEKGELTIQLKSRNRSRKRTAENESREKRERLNQGFTVVKFPSKSPKEAWKFTVLLKILHCSHEALVTGNVTTKRDIYYRDPELFIKQDVVDRYVDDIAYTLGVERDALNVVAAAKGLVAGSFAMTRRDKSIVDYNTEPDGILIPNTKEIKELVLDGIKWILVIEKEATFRTLATNQYWRSSAAGKGIIITAKGYPDIQTRQFLRLLSTTFPELPILCLVDFDPDGIGIMSTYKHGSISLAHESANLAVPSIQWLGIKSCDLVDQEQDEEGLLKLTARDRRVAGKMLERDGMVEEDRRELQKMLMLNMKAEIQILGNGDELGEWLDRKLLDAVRIEGI